MARFAIDAPEVEVTRGGLLSVARVVDAPKEAQYLGVTHVIGDVSPPVPIPDEGEEKDFGIFEERVEWDPFTLYKGIEYAMLLGETPDVEKLFTAGESYGVEKGLQEQVLNPQAVDLTPTPGEPVTNIMYAYGLLEQYAADHYAGMPLLHGNKIAVSLASQFLADSGSGVLHSKLGTPIATGGGYGADGPDGITAPAGSAWLYVTGGVTIMRGPLEVYPTANLKGNRALVLAERTYVPVVNNFVAAILVGI
jgi:hypothetical protein